MDNYNRVMNQILSNKLTPEEIITLVEEWERTDTPQKTQNDIEKEYDELVAKGIDPCFYWLGI